LPLKHDGSFEEYNENLLETLRGAAKEQITVFVVAIKDIRAPVRILAQEDLEQNETIPTVSAVGSYGREWLSSLQIQKCDEVLKTEERNQHRGNPVRKDDLQIDDEMDGIRFEGSPTRK
jgi:hypothetical protein